MSNDNVILRFSEVSFEYNPEHQILDEASFSLRNGSKLTLMGQNGAGKSTLFKLITEELKPIEGGVFRSPRDITVAVAKQTMAKEFLSLTVRDYFATAFSEVKYNLDKLIAEVFDAVNLDVPITKHVRELSGGQQARLLLAYSLIQKPDILLLDEPTNNLDQAGIDHLTGFLMVYDKTCLVISHDAEFLNSFTDGVLYLNIYNHKIEQYNGNYFDVLEEIKNRNERENLQNARAAARIKEKRATAEVFAHKGGKLRGVAKKMRENADEAESDLVDIRKDDKTIRDFIFQSQEVDKFFDGKVMTVDSVSAMKHHEVVTKKIDLVIRRGEHVLISGPNGIGKSTLLQSIALGTGEHFKIAEGVRVGYYQQDFGNLDFEKTAYDVLKEVMPLYDDHELRKTAALFLLTGKALTTEVKFLSEGQKGLLAFCRLTLLKPGLLILDEPTNHINFRHLPIIAKALDAFDGALVMVSHAPDFVSQIRIDKTIDLGKLA